mmetsp:Transcript_17020/g.33266  ORF Transcript_17020/g.33266 Transcript_17020/m.33266 type:complete len:261 (+) Transcript_17020:1206-1988(+)
MELKDLLASLLVVQSLAHGTVLVSHIVLLVTNLTLVKTLGNLEGESRVAESKVFGGEETCKEDVNTITHVEGHGNHTVGTRGTVKAADKVTHVVKNGKIVLNNSDEGAFTDVGEGANRTGSVKTLANIEVTGRLVNEVSIGTLHTDNGDGETLQLTTRKNINVTVKHVVKIKNRGELVHDLLTTVRLGLEEGADLTLGHSADLINPLNLDDGLEVILKNFGEIVLQFTTTVHEEDFLPVRGVIKAAKVGLELTSENLNRG